VSDVSFYLYWSPTTGPFDDPTPDWVDISERFVSATTNRGRQFELDRIEAGSATITIEDQTRSFDPLNVNGEFYPNVRPLKQFQLAVGYTADFPTIHPIFTGYATGYKTTWEDPDVAMCEITLADGFEIFSNADIVSTAAVLTTAQGGNADLTFTSKVTGPGGNTITVQYASGAGVTVALNGLDVVVTVDGTSNEATTVMDVVNADTIVGSLLDVSLAPGSDGSGFPNVMDVTNLAGGEFQTELTGTRINTVCDNIGWSVGRRAINPGTVNLIAQQYILSDDQKALAHINDIENSGLGIFFMGLNGDATFHDFIHRLNNTRSTTSQGTFGDDTPLTELEYIDLQPNYDDIHIYNIIAVTPDNSDRLVSAQDTDSIAEYGERVFSVTTQIRVTEHARSLCAFLLFHYKDPAFRFDSIEVQPVSEDDLWDQVFVREISDRITVNRRPPDYSGGITTLLTQDCFIESVAWNIPAGAPDPTVTYLLSPAYGPGTDAAFYSDVSLTLTDGVLGVVSLGELG
jgi:hypothetical protein